MVRLTGSSTVWLNASSSRIFGADVVVVVGDADVTVDELIIVTPVVVVGIVAVDVAVVGNSTVVELVDELMVVAEEVVLGVAVETAGVVVAAVVVVGVDDTITAVNKV